jgi:hypothetical protein
MKMEAIRSFQTSESYLRRRHSTVTAVKTSSHIQQQGTCRLLCHMTQTLSRCILLCRPYDAPRSNKLYSTLNKNSKIKNKTSPCSSAGGWSLASNRDGPGLNPGQVMWDLWMRWHWAGFLGVLQFISSTAAHSSSIQGWYNRTNSSRRTQWSRSQLTPRNSQNLRTDMAPPGCT